MDDLEPASDAELLHLCRSGSQAAWSALVRRYQRLVYTVPRRAGLTEAEAADVFQCTYAGLYTHVHRLAHDERLRAWLVTTARRETLRRLADRQRHPAVLQREGGTDHDAESTLPDPAPLPPEQLEQLQIQDRVRRAVRGLDPRSRQLIEWLFLTDPPLPYEEISTRLAMPLGSIGPTRTRCLDKLRVALGELAD